MISFKSCFIHYPQIPNFYIANQKTGPFYDIYRPVGPRGCVIFFKIWAYPGLFSGLFIAELFTTSITTNG